MTPDDLCEVSHDDRRCDLVGGHGGLHMWLNETRPLVVAWGYVNSDDTNPVGQKAMTSADRSRRYRVRKAAAEGRELGRVGRPQAEHGTGSRYARGCRCAECRQAHTERIRAWRARREDSA